MAQSYEPRAESAPNNCACIASERLRIPSVWRILVAEHISGQRKDRSQAIIRKKIETLENWLADGVPSEAFVPRNMAEFRLWEDNALKLERIGSPNTIDKPHNRQLKVRAAHLIKGLTQKENKKEGKARELDRLRIDSGTKEALIQDLTDQLHTIREESNRAMHDVRRLKNRNEELLRENGELTQKLNSLVSLRPVAQNAPR
jgi:hypothetical protein